MNGFFNVYKTPDMTSSDVVVKLRGILRSRTGTRFKVGHLGTLDPAATGVLPIAVGSATRLFNYMLDKVKIYRATFVWGVTTDTLDGMGQKIATGPLVEDVDLVRAVVPQMVGTYGQIPPQYSAKSVDGVRAYDLARRGVQVDLQPRTITVFSMQMVEYAGNRFTFDITCSAGTYIRAICRDMAMAMGTVGYMQSLLRVRSGEFDISSAHTLGDIEVDYMAAFLPLTQYAHDLPAFCLEESLRRTVDNGVPYAVDFTHPLVRVEVGGAPYGIGTRQNGLLKIICRF